jgi:hypothetical protein
LGMKNISSSLSNPSLVLPVKHYFHVHYTTIIMGIINQIWQGT